MSQPEPTRDEPQDEPPEDGTVMNVLASSHDSVTDFQSLLDEGERGEEDERGAGERV